MIHATKMTGSNSDDWIYLHLVIHSLLIMLTYKQYSTIAHLHTLQFTIAHILGFFLSFY
jgi:hypothetical protein